jgi:hypothetical protein
MKVQKEMRMRLKVGLLMAAMLAVATAARANLSIVVGAHDLQPNQAGQTVQIFVVADGGEQIGGITFRAQQGDAGPAFGGVDVGPLMTGSIIGPGELFSTNNTGVSDGSFGGMFVDLGTTTNAPTVITLAAGPSLLAHIGLSARTGFKPVGGSRRTR